MAYTYKTLTFVWLIVFGLVALSGSGMVTGSWVLLLAGVALVMPTLILTLVQKPGSTGAATTGTHVTAITADERDRLPQKV